jgi:uncharacterized protein
VNGQPFSGGGAAPAVPLRPADTPPTVTATAPVDRATNATATGNLTVTFSEPVMLSDGWFWLICSDTGSHRTATVSGGPTTFSIDPATDLVPGEVCILSIYGDAVQDLDEIPHVMLSDLYLSFTVAAQGAVTVR